MSLDLTHVLVALALLFAAFVKGTTGFGFPLIATPTVALLLDIRTAVTILIIPNIVMDIAQVFRGGFPYSVLKRFAWLLALTVFGVFAGTKILVTLPLWVLNLCLGAMVLMFVLSSLLSVEFTVSPGSERFASPIAGILTGLLKWNDQCGGSSVGHLSL